MKEGLLENRPMVTLNALEKKFGNQHILRNITHTFKNGSKTVVLGSNGSGKSTLIKTLAGVHKPDEGEIIFEGEKIVFDSPKDALDIGIGTVYQDLALVSLMSVTRNFFMGREPLKGPPFLKTFDIDEVSLSSNNTNKEEALSALEVLGFNRRQSEKVITAILKETPNETVELLIKKALKNL